MASLVNRNMQPTARNLRDLINFWRDGLINSAGTAHTEQQLNKARRVAQGRN